MCHHLVIRLVCIGNLHTFVIYAVIRFSTVHSSCSTTVLPASCSGDVHEFLSSCILLLIIITPSMNNNLTTSQNSTDRGFHGDGEEDDEEQGDGDVEELVEDQGRDGPEGWFLKMFRGHVK